MRTITREQFFAEWREECQLFLRRRCAGFGSQLLDAIKKGTLVVESEAFMRAEFGRIARVRKADRTRRRRKAG